MKGPTRELRVGSLEDDLPSLQLLRPLGTCERSFHLCLRLPQVVMNRCEAISGLGSQMALWELLDLSSLHADNLAAPSSPEGREAIILQYTPSKDIPRPLRISAPSLDSRAPPGRRPWTPCAEGLRTTAAATAAWLQCAKGGLNPKP